MTEHTTEPPPAKQPRHSIPADEAAGSRPVTAQRSTAWIGVAVAAVAIGIAVATVATTSTTSRPSTVEASVVGSAEPEREATVAAQPVNSEIMRLLPEITTWTHLREPPLDANPQAELDGTIAHPKHEVPVYQAPGQRPIGRLPVEQLSNPTWLPVIARQPGWLQVLLPSRPNGATGWIVDDEDQVELDISPYRIEINLTRRELTLYHEGREAGRWSAGIGTSKAPTPTGRTGLLASIQPPGLTYSPFLLPVGLHSETHLQYGAGPGTVALHAWTNDSVYGTASSDGCIRIPPQALQALRNVPLGTPVRIST